jgi:hypothetical protein
MKYSIIIELDSHNDELTCTEIERNIMRAIRPYLREQELEIAHLEAAAGSLNSSFNVPIV